MGQRQRLDSLTSLRYLAALLVLLYHMSTLFWRQGLLSVSFSNGFVGVTFFFVLSGFVLTWSRQPSTEKSRFYAHRFARVWPLHALTWAMMLALLTANGQHPQPGPAAANLFLVQDWIPVPSYYLSINVPSWTLSCELVFYLSFPFIIPRLVSRSSRWLWFLTGAIGIALIATGLIAYWAGQSTHHSGAAVLVAHFYPVLRLAQFVLGIALALLVERGWRCPVPVWLAVLVAVVPLAIAGVVSGRAGGSLVVMDAVTLPVLWLIVASAASAELSGRRLWALTNASSVRLGQWSFGLYLLQYPALVALADLGAHPRMNLLNAVLGVFALTCVSGAVFTLFERPVERVLRRRLTPGSVASATTLVPSETEGRA